MAYTWGKGNNSFQECHTVLKVVSSKTQFWMLQNLFSTFWAIKENNKMWVLTQNKIRNSSCKINMHW